MHNINILITDCLNVFVDPVHLSTFPLDLAIAPALENTLLWYETYIHDNVHALMV